MCSVIVSIGASQAWPLLLAANRDERVDRPALSPACHWPDRPDVLGGLDVLAGGTWLALNKHGVVAAVLNRTGTLGPAPGKRSRGELPLMALQHTRAQSAAEALSALDGGEWRSFNLLVADHRGAFLVRGFGEGRVETARVARGVHMITAQDLDDAASPRIARHLPRFQDARPPSPPDWAAWPGLLADRSPPEISALNIPAISGFGTVSSALVALGPDKPPQFLVSVTPTTADSFQKIALPARWN